MHNSWLFDREFYGSTTVLPVKYNYDGTLPLRGICVPLRKDFIKWGMPGVASVKST
jgi:hypothetical protein